MKKNMTHVSNFSDEAIFNLFDVAYAGDSPNYKAHDELQELKRHDQHRYAQLERAHYEKTCGEPWDC